MRRKILVVFASLLVVVGVSLGWIACLPGDADVEPSQPDLVPVRNGADVNYCNVDDQNRLVVCVKNQGGADAPASTTRVEFKWGGTESQTVDLPTPLIIPHNTECIPTNVEFPMGCFDPDCGFTITVDYGNAITESNETNNSADGLCLG